MCLLAIAWRCHERYDLVFVGNRDEFFARPTEGAHWWQAGDRAMFGGRDLQGGGTWLGLREDGAFATVTNVRQPDARSRGDLSRGHLVTEALRCDEVMSALGPLQAQGDAYAHYNLLIGQLTPTPRLAYLNNVDGDLQGDLAPGIHVLSNHRLNTPWPKAERVRTALTRLVDEPSRAPDDQSLITALMSIMHDRDAAPDHTLPATGLPLDRERALSSPFIDTPAYGTRATTVILADKARAARFVEQSFAPHGASAGRVDERLILDVAGR